MTSPTPELIKGIAKQLDCKFRAFIHKKTGEMVFVPNELAMFYIDLDEWSEEFARLDENHTDYLEID